MRIVGGSFRGKKLLFPEDKRVRPTSDRAREALFNILSHDSEMRQEQGPLPLNSRVLDVFSGTGALGLEALSRGAAHVTFVDNHPDSLKLIEGNVKNMGARQNSDILRRDALNIGRPGAAYDLVLMDPPYKAGLTFPTLISLAEGGWLKPDTVIVIELAAKEKASLPSKFQMLKERTYGAAKLIFLRAEPGQYDDTSQTDHQ